MNKDQKTALENHISKIKDIILNYAIENANMRDRLEELGELEELIKDGSVKPYEQKHSASVERECVGA
jgi:predicted ABC-class ATPase